MWDIKEECCILENKLMYNIIVCCKGCFKCFLLYDIVRIVFIFGFIINVVFLVFDFFL